eukprot:675988-Alexandrium_andersonii.AAC.1
MQCKRNANAMQTHRNRRFPGGGVRVRRIILRRHGRQGERERKAHAAKTRTQRKRNANASE